MPAEIDTGGPRVLHCDYRADCPISIVAECSSRRENRVVGGASVPRGFPAVGDESSGVRRRRRVTRRGGSRAGLCADDTGTASVVGREIVPTWSRWDARVNDERSDGGRGSGDDSTTIRSRVPELRCEGAEGEAETLLPALTAGTWKDATNSRSGASGVAKVVPAGDRASPSRKTDADRGTGKRKRRGDRSAYIQLALLLLLAAFGQCGLRKHSAFNCSGKPSATPWSVLAIGTVISAVSAAPIDLTGDAGVRAERSANLSHITGASRKIQMYIKNRHLQILPDGTVNGSNDDTSEYTIFQRTSVSRGQLRIQGVATCLYLCMDSCGLLYGSREYTDDCVFNETLEQHNYNTYSSAKWSTAKKTLYLGLNRRGQPRRVQAKGHNLGRLSAYARVLTQVAPLERVEALQRRMLGAHHNVRHRHSSHRGDLLQQSLCPTLPAQEKDGRDKFRCRKRKKRKKRKRKCRPGEKPGPQCQLTEETSSVVIPAKTEGPSSNVTSPESKRSCEGAASGEACRREALSVPSKKRKLRVEQPAEDQAPPNGRNVTAGSNGKSKAPASKKLTVAGGMSESKKPNLTDGKKRKKKGPATRRSQAVPLARKRFFTPGGVDNTSAPLTPTSVSTSITSSSSGWSPGASTGPSGRGISPERGTPGATAPNSAAIGPRRVGKAFGKNRTRTVDRGTRKRDKDTGPGRGQPRLLKVPDTDGPPRNPSPMSVDPPAHPGEEDTSGPVDEDSTASGERAATTTEATFTSTEMDNASTTFRFAEETTSTEDDDGDDVQSTTHGIPLERLAM